MDELEHQDDLINFLKNPDHYPHKPSHIQIIQTHASILAIAPPFVYKFKKQVDLGFMDLRLLESRKKNFEREIELNSRLCPDLYLEIVPIIKKDQQLTFGSGKNMVDVALKMNQLADGFFLDQLLKKHKAGPEILDRIIYILINFYKRQPGNEEIKDFGRPSHIHNITEENFHALSHQAAEIVEPEALEALSALTDLFLKKNKILFEKRIEENKIKDGHGDLRLEHIHIKEGNICIYDCLEFSDRYRHTDIACDIAFLAMDLDFHLRPDLSRYLVQKFAELTRDPDLLKLTDFYKSYRACVRAKVESIKFGQSEVPEDEKIVCKTKGRQYLSLALKYTTLSSAPVVLVVFGMVGTGKSTVASRLGQLLDLPVVSSDKIRKGSAGLPLDQPTKDQIKKTLYSPQKSDEVYDQLLELALSQIKKSGSVVVDATFSKSQYRKKFRQAFSELSVPVYFVELQASDQTLKERLYQRDFQDNVISDARLQDFEKLKAAYDPVVETLSENYIKVTSEFPLNKSVNLILRQLGAILYNFKNRNP